ncbi:MAG: protein-L-isoaspartate O-methyltransferase [Pseudomonadales bacterium]|nr:protein-L-isoaspartate O-methyltransferase [Pseudomonadales bacterium]
MAIASTLITGVRLGLTVIKLQTQTKLKQCLSWRNIYRQTVKMKVNTTILLMNIILAPPALPVMTEMLNVQSHHTVLEIGTGCGYQAAILSLLVKKVISLEIVKALADSTKKRLKKLNYQNIEVFCFNGKKGWVNDAPYDRIITTAAPTQVPDALIEQLAPNGQMVIPVGPDVNHQYLHIITKNKRGIIQTKQSLPVRFVPMI